jgi:D-alanyl-D-alanine carboxypeptidase
MSGATIGGRQVTVMVNLNPGGTVAQDADIQAAVSAALCEPTSPGARSDTDRLRGR